MSLEELGVGAGSGLLGTFLAYMGFSKRLDTIEKRAEADKAEASARIIALEEQTLYKDVHAECSRSWHDALSSIDRKLDTLLQGKK